MKSTTLFKLLLLGLFVFVYDALSAQYNCDNDKNPLKVKLGNDTTICVGASLTTGDFSYAGNVTNTFLWQDNSITHFYNIKTSGIYWVEITNSLGCKGRDTIVVTVNDVKANLGGDQNLCSISSTLTPSPIGVGYTYLWSDNSFGNSLTVNQNGNYWVEVTDAKGCKGRDTVRISLSDANAKIVADVSSGCMPLLVNFTGTTKGGICTLNYGDNNSVNACSGTHTFNAAGTFKVLLTNTDNSCVLKDSTTITVRDHSDPSCNCKASTGGGKVTSIIPNASFEDLTACPNNYAQINKAAPWNNFQQGKANLFSMCDTNIWSPFKPKDLPEGKIADGNSFVAVHYGNDSKYILGSCLMSPMLAGVEYKLELQISQPANDACGFSSLPWELTLYGNPTCVSLPLAFDFVDRTQCTKYPYTKLGSVSWTPIKGKWSTISITFTPTADINFIVLGGPCIGADNLYSQNGGKCANLIIDDLILNDKKSFDAIATSIDSIGSNCSNDLVLNAKPNDANHSYQWFKEQQSLNGETSATLNLSAKNYGEGVFFVQVTDLTNGTCSKDSIVIAKGVKPHLELGNNLSKCKSAFPFDVLAPANMQQYQWQGTGTANGNKFSVTGAGWLKLKVDSAGCSIQDSIRITQIPNPMIELGSDLSLCASDFPITITATNGMNTYLWQGTGTASNNTFSASAGGWFKLQVDSASCTSKDSLQIFMQASPTVNIGKDTSICKGATIILKDASLSGGNYLYKWQDNSSNSSLTVSNTGEYFVEVSNNTGCKGRDTVMVNVTEIKVDAGTNQYKCFDKNILLTAQTSYNGNSNLNYLWNDNTTQNTLTANTAGDYWVEVSDGLCTDKDTVSISDYPIQNFTLNDTTLCDKNVLKYSISSPFSVIEWSNCSDQNSITINSSGDYSVEVKDPNNCLYSDTFEVNYQQAKPLNINNIKVCENDSVEIKIPLEYKVVKWNDNNTQQRRFIKNGGTFSVEVMDTNNLCFTSAQFSANYYNDPIVYLGLDTAICFDDEEIIALFDRKITINEGKYFWYNGDSATMYIAKEKGNYWLLESNLCGKASDSINLNALHCTHSLYIPNSFTPNGDGINEIFIPKEDGVNLEKMTIFNRWGEIIFSSNNVDAGWNGLHYLTNKLVEIDVYVYLIEGKTEYKNKRIYKKGIVTVIR